MTYMQHHYGSIISERERESDIEVKSVQMNCSDGFTVRIRIDFRVSHSLEVLG